MRKKIDPIQFLDNQAGILMLEDIILGKNADYEDLIAEKNKILNSNIYPIVQGEIKSHFLNGVWDVKHGTEFESLERELRNLTYIYRKATNTLPDDSEWQKQYEYATEQIRITDVVSHLLNPKTLKRNIKCCFHEDKSPSLKIYEKDNRFICFGCGARGSPIDFVMKYKSYDFKEAVEFINNL